LQRIKYNKTIFGPESDEEGYFLPILLSFHLGTQGRLVFLLNWYPSLFRPKLNPCLVITTIEQEVNYPKFSFHAADAVGKTALR